MTVQVAPGLYVWTITLENGEVRTEIGSLDTLISGSLPSPVVSAVRGAAFSTDPLPVITTLAPATAKLGDPSFTLHVTGTGFRAGCQILWNGSPEPTTFVSPTELTTLVNMASAQVAIDIPVAVRSLSGQDSNVATFALTATE